jgi:hypothetical protein
MVILFVLLMFNIGLSKSNAYAENKNYPVIITQVELDDAYKTIPPGFSCPQWNEMAGKRLVSYYCTENIIPKEAVQCGYSQMNPIICNPVHITYNFTDTCSFYLGFRPDGTPITTRYDGGNQWIILQNTETIPINILNFNMKWNSTGFYENYETNLSLILYPQEQCRIVSQFLETTEGTALIQYQYQGNHYTFKTPQLADYYHDSRVWKYDGTNWTFKDEPIVIDAKNQTVLSLIPSRVPSPLKQFKSGIATADIQCGHGLQLITQKANGQPACVTQKTMFKLVHRGWIMMPLIGLHIPH